MKDRLKWAALACATSLLTASLLTGPIGAQTVRDDDSPAASLKLPSNITLFGKSDPSVRKATAIVNGDVITETDIEQRLALVLAANEGRISPEEKERLRGQILRNLIDETLEIQEAKANEITITPAEVDQTFARVAANSNRTPEQFQAFLRTQGASERTLKRQIEAESAWSRLQRKKIQPFVNVAEEEVQSVISRLTASKGATELRIGEIFLSANPANAAEVLAGAQKIVENVRGGASFVAYARQFSEASTAAVGGDLGWVRPEQLPDVLATTAQGLATGGISDPIAIPGGYSIIVKIDERKVLTADPRDAVLSLKQVAMEFPKGTTQAQAAPRVEAMAKAARTIAGCGQAEQVAGALGATVVGNDNIPVRDLPAALQNMMANLQIGQATPPFGSLDEGIRFLVVCGRDDPAAGNAPSFDQVLAQMEEERVNRRAQRYLRDLRRDAEVEYR